MQFCWNTAMPLHWHIFNGCFQAITGEWVIVTGRPHGLQNWKCLLSGPSQNKFAASCLRRWQRICPPIQETQETWVWSLGQKDPLKKEMATHSSFLAWKFQAHRIQVGPCPWGLRADMAEWLSMHVWHSRATRWKKPGSPGEMEVRESPASRYGWTGHWNPLELNLRRKYTSVFSVPSRFSWCQN